MIVLMLRRSMVMYGDVSGVIVLMYVMVMIIYLLVMTMHVMLMLMYAMLMVIL